MSDLRAFLYRTLDPEEAQALATKHLTRHDEGELSLQYSLSEAFGFDDGRLKTADYNNASGFGLRGVTGETTAFAHANEISAAAINRAASTLRLLDPAKAAPSAAPPRTNQAMYGADDPLSAIPFADKVRLCAEIDAAARARDPRVDQVSVSLAGSWSVIDIVRAGGFVASDVRPMVRLDVSIVAKNGDHVAAHASHPRKGAVHARSRDRVDAGGQHRLPRQQEQRRFCGRSQTRRCAGVETRGDHGAASAAWRCAAL